MWVTMCLSMSYEGEVFAVIGPNGAGETTVIKMPLGLFTPSPGETEIFGYKIPKQRKGTASRLGLFSKVLETFVGT